MSFVTLDTDTLILLASSSNGKCLEAFDVKTLTPLLAEPYMDSGASPNSSICLISSIKLTATSALIATATDASEITLHKLHLHSSLHISTLAAVTLPSPSPLILATSFFSSHLGLNRALAMGAELGSPDPTNLHLCIATSTTTSFSLDCCTNQLSPLRLLADLPADHLYARASVRFPSVYKASAFLNVTTFERVALAEAALPPPPASVLKPTSLLATSPPPKQSPLSRVQPPLKETQNVMKSTSSASSTIRTQSSGYGATQPQMKMGVAPSAAKKQHKQLLLKRKKQQQEMLQVRAQARSEFGSKTRPVFLPIYAPLVHTAFPFVHTCVWQTRSATVYPTDCDTLTCHQEKHDYLLGEDVPVAHVKFHPLSTHLAIVKMDHSVEVKQLPFGGNKRAPIQIDGQARGAGQHPSVPGFAGNLLAYDDAVYDVTKAPKSGSTSLPPVLRIEGATQLCFYYNTKFLLSVSGKNVVKMHAFGGASGVSRTEVASFAHGSSITALQAVNSGLSNLVFTAGADRSLRVIDVNTGADCWAVPNAAGGRKVGCLALPGVYPSAALPAESYNLIAASSTDQGGLINLWDVRAASPAALFKGHVNRVSVSGVAFSPCMRYVSVGSEDVGGACSYDLRMGGGRGVSWRCKEGRGVKEGAVVAVEYNPIFPQLCTATLGGVVKFYNSS